MNRICNDCGFRAYDKAALKKHSLKLHFYELKKYRCAKCGYSRNAKKKILKHFEAEHPDKKVRECEHCDFVTNKKIAFKRHNIFHHASAVPIVNEQKIKDPLKFQVQNKFKCDDCAKKFTSRRDLLKHIANKHKKIQGLSANLPQLKTGVKLFN